MQTLKLLTANGKTTLFYRAPLNLENREKLVELQEIIRVRQLDISVFPMPESAEYETDLPVFALVLEDNRLIQDDIARYLSRLPIPKHIAVEVSKREVELLLSIGPIEITVGGSKTWTPPMDLFVYPAI